MITCFNYKEWLMKPNTFNFEKHPELRLFLPTNKPFVILSFSDEQSAAFDYKGVREFFQEEYARLQILLESGLSKRVVTYEHQERWAHHRVLIDSIDEFERGEQVVVFPVDYLPKFRSYITFNTNDMIIRYEEE